MLKAFASLQPMLMPSAHEAHQTAPPAQPLAPLARAKADLPAHDADLAGYALHRSSMAMPLDADKMSRLQQAQRAMSNARADLHLGRSNVREDLALDPKLYVRAFALRAAVHDPQDVPRDPYSVGVMTASAARYARTGMCQEFAETTNLHYLPTLAQEEATYMVGSEKLGHTWLEAVRPDGVSPHHDEGPVVLDAWRSGPAVMGIDSANHAPDANDDTGTGYDGQAYRHYNPVSAHETMRRLELIDKTMGGTRAGSTPGEKTRLEEWGKNLPNALEFWHTRLANSPLPEEFRFSDSATFSESFKQRARAAWLQQQPSTLPDALRLDVLATGVAQAWSPSVRDRVNMAPQIRQAAEKLLSLPTPPMMPYPTAMEVDPLPMLDVHSSNFDTDAESNASTTSFHSRRNSLSSNNFNVSD